MKSRSAFSNRVQAVDQSDRDGTAVEHRAETAPREEVVAGLREDVCLGPQRLLDARLGIDADDHGRWLVQGERPAAKGADLDRRGRRQQAVQPLEPDQIMLPRHPQLREPQMRLGHPRLTLERRLEQRLRPGQVPHGCGAPAPAQSSGRPGGRIPDVVRGQRQETPYLRIVGERAPARAAPPPPRCPHRRA